MGQTTVLRRKSGVLEAERIIGCKVENPQGEDLGKIETLIVDIHENRIVCAVLSFGGFLGLGEKLFPVPLDALMFSADGERAIFDIDKDRLKNAPGYERDRLPDMRDRNWTSRIYSHYGYTPYWE